MDTPNESTDPLSPAYPEGGPKARLLEKKGGMDSRTNITALVLIAVVVLAAMLYLARDKEVPAPEPAAKEIKPE